MPMEKKWWGSKEEANQKIWGELRLLSQLPINRRHNQGHLSAYMSIMVWVLQSGPIRFSLFRIHQSAMSSKWCEYDRLVMGVLVLDTGHSPLYKSFVEVDGGCCRGCQSWYYWSFGTVPVCKHKTSVKISSLFCYSVIMLKAWFNECIK
jgi:hypothetical protein